ncbi:uncharacterized protein LOC115724663 isoform X2 [Cannabis sativa]|uniref:uncharacterized protein LOC115724663 isoform X2 n=1 Tax=Cannabis sativa TaxID=3483 RepID=UPI0011DFB254|nr:uncharacterized protein LOC115724663 isoform X2 [Cannabis sativa]
MSSSSSSVHLPLSILTPKLDTPKPQNAVTVRLPIHSALSLFSLGSNSALASLQFFTFLNGEYAKSGLAGLEKWIVNAGDEAVVVVWWDGGGLMCF